MRYTHLELVRMAPHDLRVAAITCMLDALEYWPRHVKPPEPDPHEIAGALCALINIKRKGMNLKEACLYCSHPPESLLWNKVRYTTIETCSAGDVLLAIRAAMRGFGGTAARDPMWGRSFDPKYSSWVAWVAVQFNNEPADQIMEAQKFIERLRHTRRSSG